MYGSNRFAQHDEDPSQALLQLFLYCTKSNFWGPYLSWVNTDELGLDGTNSKIAYAGEVDLLHKLQDEVVERLASKNTLDFLLAKGCHLLFKPQKEAHLENSSRWHDLISILGSDSHLIFSFKKDLKGIDYFLYENGRERLFLSSALLVRDRKLLQKSPDWERNKHQFFEGIFWVKVDRCIYLCSQGVWSPSVDAVVLLEAFKENQSLFSQSASVLDLGCGTGVIGIGIALNSSVIQDIFMYDTNPKALAITSMNLYLNAVDKCVTFLTGRSLSLARADLCIATPYYIPVEKKVLRTPKIDIEQAINTTVSMITYAVDHCEKHAMFVYSSATQKEVCERIPRHEILKEQEALFTIGDNVGNNDVVKYLIDDRRLKRIDGDYYHTIYVGLIQKKERKL